MSSNEASGTKRKKDAKPAPGFESSLERLEKIVGEMESGSLPLEQMIERFEEGQKLIRLCTRKLNEVEKKIEVLVKKDGDTVAEPFEAGDEASAEAPPGTKGGDELF